MSAELSIKVHLIGGPLDGRETTIARRWPTHPAVLRFPHPVDAERIATPRPINEPASDDARIRVVEYRYRQHENEDSLNIYYAFEGLRV